MHVGNGVNFVLTYLLTRFYNGKLRLRIDDSDITRVREKYIDNIFATLEYLGIEYDEGAKSTTDYYKNYKFDVQKYKYELEKIKNSPFIYPCECSRKDIISKNPKGIYPQTCLHKKIKYDTSLHNLRLHVKKDTSIKINDKQINLHESVGDFVIWRKDDLPSYNFASTVDDIKANTTLIVRGEDLLHSSASQIYLADIFGWNFKNVKFLHHPLVKNLHEKKLSKSTKSPSLLETDKHEVYIYVQKMLNLPKDANDSILTLLQALKENPKTVENFFKKY